MSVHLKIFSTRRKYILSGEALLLRCSIMKIKSNLREILKERGLKQGFIAEKAGISQTTFSYLVTGKSLPTLEVAYKIAKVLDLQVEYIWIPENEEEDVT
jgi:DNA-binding XRE family transcriptional regulator